MADNKKTIGKKKAAANGEASPLAKAAEELKDAAPELAEDVEEAAAEVADTVSSKVKEATETARQAVSEKAADIGEAFDHSAKEMRETIARLREEVTKLKVAEARERVRTWVEENPTLTVVLAVGAGLIAGRLLTKAFTAKPPPPLPERLRAQSRRLAAQARDVAHDVSDVVSERAAEALDEVSRRARAVASVASARAHELGESVSEQSSRAAESFEEATQDLSQAAHARARHGFDLAEGLLSAARTVTAAVIVKKITDWFRR